MLITMANSFVTQDDETFFATVNSQLLRNYIGEIRFIEGDAIARNDKFKALLLRDRNSRV